MNTYESKQKQLFVSQIEAYNKLSDLKNIEPYVSAIKQQFQDKIQDISIDSNYISLSVENINVVFKIIDREEYKTIKFAVDNIPLSANMWIQLKEISEMETRMKLTIKADIPFFLKPMVGDKLEKGIDEITAKIERCNEIKMKLELISRGLHGTRGRGRLPCAPRRAG